MPYADELLELAQRLGRLDAGKPDQASLRRAVSTAYYALFHLLISDATLNWNRVELRPVVGRLFEHGKMRSASAKKVSDLNAYFKKKPADGPELAFARHLYTVANSFTESQDSRNAADYDTSKPTTKNDVVEQIATVTEAFESWEIIREEPVAQAFLVSMLGKDRG